MHLLLKPHPASSAPAVRIEADAERPNPDSLTLRYVVSGEVGALLFPPTASPGRADELWRHTCFEAFLRTPAEAGYLEFNFSPSTQWAAYRFSDYREGMADLDSLPRPQIEIRRDSGCLELAVRLELEAALGLLAELPWQLGLSAVIEAKDGAKSYWALAHPFGDPDFHHRDCFALELPPPKPA